MSEVSMTASNLKDKAAGCIFDIIVNSPKYAGVWLGVLKELCADVILGQYFEAIGTDARC